MTGTKRLARRTVAAAIIGAVVAMTGCASPAAARARPAPQTVPASARDYLTAVSCVSGTFCVAVGSDFGTGRSLAESWNGQRWHLMAGSAATTRLSSVSCTSTSFCMAVGGGAAQLWDGKKWWEVRTPGVGQPDMLSVSCATRSSCLAVGSGAAQRWNGTSWQPVTLPSGGIGLSAVACVSASFCLATGSQGRHLGTVSLSRALAWNGTTWRATHPPSPGRFAALSGVACLTASACLAIGWHGHCHQPPQPLGQTCFFSLRWNGRAWTRLPSRASTPLVASLACGATGGCMAVGDCNLTANCRGTIALAWNGPTWRQRPALAPGRHGSSLEGVACWSRTACLATGGAVSSSGALLTLAEAWNGRRWRVLPAPSPAG